MRIQKEVVGNSYFLVSRAFVDEFIDKLSGNAVKLYLFILSQWENGGIMFGPATAKALCISDEDYEKAINELNDFGIITYEKDNYIEITAPEKLHENKKNYLDQKYKEKTEDDSYKAEYKSVLGTINSEFFGGKMTIAWYNNIEKFAKEYGFLPETIYLLFSECNKIKDRTEAGYTAYVKKVAEVWYQSNVKTPEDAARLVDARNRRNAYIGFVQKKLNFSRNFTEAEIKAICSWSDSGITTEMLSVILDDTNRVSAITIGKIDGIVAKWKEAGVTTQEQAIAFKATQKQTKDTKKPNQTNTQAHFDNERNYSDDYLNELLNRDKNGGAK